MVMKYLQRIGKSLMLPVATLPVCAILMGLGYVVSPPAMGAEGWNASGFGFYVGVFLIKAGGALIDNMGLLFAVGIAIGMSKDQHGVSALAGLVAWLVVTTLCSAGTTEILRIFTVDGKANPAFGKIANPFIGITTGILAGHSYNLFKDVNLPAYLSFFSGKRCVSIIVAAFAIIYSLVLYLVWPVLYTNCLLPFGKFMSKIGIWGAGLYGLFNRLLIPTGLHHALNSVFWFDVANVNDIATFWGGQWSDTLQAWTDSSGKVISGMTKSQPGMYMAGWFPIFMFALPAACLAMYHAARPEKKKETMGILGAAALAAFFSGVTEPIEFAFMFTAPLLYGIHSVLTAVSMTLCAALNLKAGFFFSAGIIDYALSFLRAMHLGGNPWALPLVGIAFAVVYYFVFRILITKLNLATTGREAEETNSDTLVKGANDFTGMASIIIEGLGGKGNIKSVDNCTTRLRIVVKDDTLVNENLIKKAKVSGVKLLKGGNVQVIIGLKVQFVCDEMKRQLA